MNRRMFCVILVVSIVVGMVHLSPVPTAASSKTPKSSTEAVAEMTWGPNLADLYMADIKPGEGETYGYDNFTPKAQFGIAAWFWDNSFDWLCYYDTYAGSFSVDVNIPDYPSSSESSWVTDLFRIGILVKSMDQTVSITLSDSKITKSDRTVIPLTGMDQTYTGKPVNGPDFNGWCTYYINAPDETPEKSKDLNGAVFSTTVTVNPEGCTTTSKSDYYFELYRTPFHQETLTDLFLDEGANVFRLPVTWTWFVDNNTFEIDREWLAAVKTEVDYILGKGAYCILNMHNDYMIRSFVATKSQTTGAWENFKWTRDWMNEEYDEYVNARFAAVWRQIAEYFKEYSDHLIFESCNEPTMEWVDSNNYNTWITRQKERVNEINKLFVDTVRETGGKNETRLLCLATADYNRHPYLSALTIPEDSDYLMVQIHSYNELEDSTASFNYETETNLLFEDVAAFQKKYPKVPVIVGEVGISHSTANTNNMTATVEKVAYFFSRAEELGVPCLWWEDYFPVSESGRNHTYWLYDKIAGEWGRPKILNAIKEISGSMVLTGIEITDGPIKTEYTEGEFFAPDGMVVTASYSNGITKEVTGYTYLPAGTLSSGTTSVTVSYSEGDVTETATVNIVVGKEERGDVDNNGVVNETDCDILKYYFAGYPGYADRIINYQEADIDRDEQLTRRDAMILARRIAKWNSVN